MGHKKGGTKDNMVKWGKICQPKMFGGMRIKDLVIFNKTLVGKWRWGLLFEQQELWAKVLRLKCGNDVFG